MARGKNINFYLIDGDVNGRIKCSLSNWIGTVFKIPRTLLDICKERLELKQTGVYFLFGKDEVNNTDVVYIGQASIRQNGEGLLMRLQEHNRNPQKDYWTESIAITTSNDSLGPTEISYLEHRFYQMAIEAKRYDVKNTNNPTPGNITEEKISELEEFIEYAQIIIGTLGHKVFVPLIDTSDNGLSNREDQVFYCNRSGVHATSIRTAEGFVLKKGSTINPRMTRSCPEFVTKKRDQYKKIIDENYTLLEDILFNTPSGAAAFVCGSSANGNIEWKTAEGKTLKQITEES